MPATQLQPDGSRRRGVRLESRRSPLPASADHRKPSATPAVGSSPTHARVGRWPAPALPDGAPPTHPAGSPRLGGPRQRLQPVHGAEELGKSPGRTTSDSAKPATRARSSGGSRSQAVASRSQRASEASVRVAAGARRASDFAPLWDEMAVFPWEIVEGSSPSALTSHWLLRRSFR
jgi:hypothetical protein